MNTHNWIAVDWGTSHLRVWNMSAQGKIIDHRRSDQGMTNLTSNQFESTLIDLTEDWLSNNAVTQVIACGMVGSRQGWIEADYLGVPCVPNVEFTPVKVNDTRIKVNILPGIKQLSPADVMRGEETQIAGLLVKNPTYTGIICLPGTHSKWVNMVNGEIKEFQTFITGELFALLSEKSVLRHSIDGSSWDEGAFKKTIKESIENPQRTMAKLFSLRAESLVSHLSGETAYARLSGLLIGLELANCKHFMTDNDIDKVVIIGESQLSKHYTSALNMMSIKTQQESSETMTLQGLTLAYQKSLVK